MPPSEPQPGKPAKCAPPSQKWRLELEGLEWAGGVRASEREERRQRQGKQTNRQGGA